MTMDLNQAFSQVNGMFGGGVPTLSTTSIADISRQMAQQGVIPWDDPRLRAMGITPGQGGPPPQNGLPQFPPPPPGVGGGGQQPSNGLLGGGYPPFLPPQTSGNVPQYGSPAWGQFAANGGGTALYNSPGVQQLLAQARAWQDAALNPSAWGNGSVQQAYNTFAQGMGGAGVPMSMWQGPVPQMPAFMMPGSSLGQQMRGVGSQGYRPPQGSTAYGPRSMPRPWLNTDQNRADGSGNAYNPYTRPSYTPAQNSATPGTSHSYSDYGQQQPPPQPPPQLPSPGGMPGPYPASSPFMQYQDYQPSYYGGGYLPRYATGTMDVPESGPAYLEKGEMVVPTPTADAMRGTTTPPDRGSAYLPTNPVQTMATPTATRTAPTATTQIMPPAPTDTAAAAPQDTTATSGTTSPLGVDATGAPYLDPEQVAQMAARLAQQGTPATAAAPTPMAGTTSAEQSVQNMQTMQAALPAAGQTFAYSGADPTRTQALGLMSKWWQPGQWQQFNTARQQLAAKMPGMSPDEVTWQAAQMTDGGTSARLEATGGQPRTFDNTSPAPQAAPGGAGVTISTPGGPTITVGGGTQQQAVAGPQMPSFTWQDVLNVAMGMPLSALPQFQQQAPQPTGGASFGVPSLTQQYINALPSPNQIVGRNWLRLDPDTQQFLLGAYEAGGYSSPQILNSIQAMMPGRQGVPLGTWGAIR